MSNTRGLVYVVDDDVSVREGVASLVRSFGLEAKGLASGQEFLAIPRPEMPSCLVLDVQLPGLSGLDVQQERRSGVNLPIIFLTGYGDIPMTVRAIQAGAADFLRKPFEKEELLRAVRRCFGRYHTFNWQPRDQFNGKVTQEKLYLEDKARSEMNFGEIIGNSASLRGLLKQVETVSPTDSTVLIYGETGTGKELIARSIHKNSQRSGRAFVSVNCAALPPSLIPSELFGHEKGRVHGSDAAPAWPFRAGGWGDDFPGRSGRTSTRHPGRVIEGATGTRIRASWGRTTSSSRRSRHRCHES